MLSTSSSFRGQSWAESGVKMDHARNKGHGPGSLVECSLDMEITLLQLRSSLDTSPSSLPLENPGWEMGVDVRIPKPCWSKFKFTMIVTGIEYPWSSVVSMLIEWHDVYHGHYDQFTTPVMKIVHYVAMERYHSTEYRSGDIFLVPPPPTSPFHLSFLSRPCVSPKRPTTLPSEIELEYLRDRLSESSIVSSARMPV